MQWADLLQESVFDDADYKLAKSTYLNTIDHGFYSFTLYGYVG